MKKLFLTTLLVLSIPSQASLLDLIDQHPTLGRVVENMGQIQLGKKDYKVTIVEENTKEQCVELFQKAKEDQIKLETYKLLSPGTLTGRISRHDIEGNYSEHFNGYTQDNFGIELLRGLSKKAQVNLNSFNDNHIPHAASGCKELAKIERVDLVEFNGKKCRSVLMNLENNEYKVLFCEKSDSILTDFLDLEAKILKSYSLEN
ncbi:hypothetical protein HBN50_10525 [Halobacteriovorax sp. GB3]|uniref:hypothetical protein n=1 Tax=Halobacteriovorax sp. GB3 TaxID=2719615 RepID=UPI00235EC701|nr:hypothetical protein [Halobacteriovorax sp. GB3]MDD0853536.1 hypothetical protein [Halobacteriovorax sp. GB3]